LSNFTGCNRIYEVVLAYPRKPTSCITWVPRKRCWNLPKAGEVRA